MENIMLSVENQLSNNKYKINIVLQRNAFNLRETCKARIFERYKIVGGK